MLVIWHDAHAASDGWCSSDAVDADPCLVESVGFLIPDAKAGYVTVAQSMANDGEIYHAFCVPVGMVVSVQIL